MAQTTTPEVVQHCGGSPVSDRCFSTTGMLVAKTFRRDGQTFVGIGPWMAVVPAGWTEAQVAEVIQAEKF